MRRRYLADAAATPPAPPSIGSDGYPSNGDPGAGVEPTTVGAYAFYMLAEARSLVIEAANLPLDDDPAQFLEALNALYLTQTEGDARYLRNTTPLRPIELFYDFDGVDITGAGGTEITLSQNPDGFRYIELIMSWDGRYYANRAVGGSLPTTQTDAIELVSTESSTWVWCWRDNDNLRIGTNATPGKCHGVVGYST